jgi:effector-binding domain-containing protein
MLKRILIVIGLLLAAVIIWLAVIDGSYNVEREVKVNVPVEKAFSTVIDLKSWTEWSPWIVMEKSAAITYNGETGKPGSSFSWKGNLVGSGTLTINSITENEKVDMTVAFKEPFPSSSGTFFTLSGDTASSTIVWGMNGEMPFFFKFMAKQIEPMIGMDYERGLFMLKELLETGKVSSTVNIIGQRETEALKYIGIKSTLNYESIGDSMKAAYTKLWNLIESNENMQFAGTPMAIYHEWGLDGGPVVYTAAIPYTGTFESMPGIIEGTIPSIKILEVEHLGRYENTGNAWATAFSYARYNKLKQNKKIDAYEIYTNDPEVETDHDKWRTVVCLPIK